MLKHFPKKVALTVLSSFFIIISIISLFNNEVYADTVNDFSIQTLDSDGNVNEQGYYDLIGNPGDKKQVSIKIFNSSEKSIKVKADVSPASTNQNGVPSYVKQDGYDSSLVYRMDDLVKLSSNEITIPPVDSVTLTASISFPKNEWEGDILGGIRFTEETETKSEETVSHEVAYTVGILLNQEKSDTLENNLNLKDITVGQRNYRNYIEVNLQNSAASIIREMTVQSKIFKNGSQDPIYINDAFDLRMAPNSNFNFGIPTGEQPLKSGKYRLEMTVVADGKEYSFEKSFSISPYDAKNLNKSAVNVTQENNNTVYIMYFILLLIIIIIYLINRKRKVSSKN